jgi:hypothetical protein
MVGPAQVVDGSGRVLRAHENECDDEHNACIHAAGPYKENCKSSNEIKYLNATGLDYCLTFCVGERVTPVPSTPKQKEAKSLGMDVSRWAPHSINEVLCANLIN